MSITKEQTKALNEMLKSCRSITFPEFADELAKPFGTSVKKLGLIPRSQKWHLGYGDDNLMCIAVNVLASQIAQQVYGSGYIGSGMGGHGSASQDITQQAVKYIEEALSQK